MGVSPFITPAAWIDENGIHTASLADWVNYLVSGYQGIYGADVVVESSSQDGEDIGIRAQCLADATAGQVQAYNSFNPTYAQGVGLSSLVKINGLEREIAVVLDHYRNVVGQAFSFKRHASRYGHRPEQYPMDDPCRHYDPAAVGQTGVEATCQMLGAISLPPGSIFTWATGSFIKGWQTVTSSGNASLGSPVEQDPTLRQRQSVSTAGPAFFPLDGINARVLAVPGVTASSPFDNSTDLADADGLPGTLSRSWLPEGTTPSGDGDLRQGHQHQYLRHDVDPGH